MGDTIHFRFVVRDDFHSLSESYLSIYAGRNLKWCTLQVDALLKAESGKVLGILVQHLSVENLIAIRTT